ncbi:MAG: glycosyltransferase family 4 protein [Lachnospiraceae bacterium]|nr:glycosyltransferase family 4 protein [Lachnospiraceae bacterium]
MKIAIILPHFYPYVGGGETMFYELAKGLLERGHELRVVARNVGDEYMGHKVVEGIDVWYCPWKSAFGHPVPKESDIEEHIEWCDLVHTSIFTTAPVVSRLAKKYGKPSLLTVYEVRGRKWFWSDKAWRAILYYIVEQYCCRQSFTAYHAISEATKADFQHYICRKKDVRRIYLASEVGLEEKKSSFSIRDYFRIRDEFIFLYYGRPGRTKGIYVLEKAICLLKQRGIDAGSRVRFCFLLGKEPEKPRREFLRRMRDDGLRGVVRVRPSISREDLAECIKQADCVVVPSLTEGFGFSALETCQLGTDLIYSDGGSLPEVAYGRCRSFKNRNAKDLADKLEAVLRGDADAFVQVPEKSFSRAQMIDGIEEIYEEMRAGC